MRAQLFLLSLVALLIPIDGQSKNSNASSAERPSKGCSTINRMPGTVTISRPSWQVIGIRQS